jgi:hypothetical protein
MKTGTHGPYKWLEADHDLHEFLSLYPGAIVGRHIAITAVDSGSFSPSEDDRAAGWTDIGGIAYSSRLESVAMLPLDCCCRKCYGFDEWYIFGTEPTPLGSICHANVFETALAFPNVFGSSTSSDSNSPILRCRPSLICFGRSWPGFAPNPTWEMVTVVWYSCHPIMNASIAFTAFSVDLHHETQIDDRGEIKMDSF